MMIRIVVKGKSVSIDEREDYDRQRGSECWTSRPLEQLHGGTQSSLVTSGLYYLRLR
jgi:hypothetical protein